MADTNNCKICGNAIYDPLWGEYKCSISQHRVYAPEKVPSDCTDFKKGTPKEAKDVRIVY